jgi:hypothetical protein
MYVGVVCLVTCILYFRLLLLAFDSVIIDDDL